MKKIRVIGVVSLGVLLLLVACNQKSKNQGIDNIEPEKSFKIAAKDIDIKKDLLYDEYTLDDVYTFTYKIKKDTIRRSFQWEKIKEYIAYVENYKEKDTKWAVVQNYKNENGKPPKAKDASVEHTRVVDSLGIKQNQSIPLYDHADLNKPARYAYDGSLTKYVKDSGEYINLKTIYQKGDWMVPKEYVKILPDSTSFNKLIAIDRTNQNICTLEKVGNIWLVRSMNPATTGMDKPPLKEATPLGIYDLQEKKSRFFFYKDGTTEIGGFAPHASRFTGGAYVHGVPVNNPDAKTLKEYSPTLGTTPLSHMCVRTATSHAKFIYDWAEVDNTYIIVIE
ncbi:MAG: L,D-transpeptidase [Dysgonomonas sp.]|nr:L,D-transpeptidase [Dysgonomonas sp.]